MAITITESQESRRIEGGDNPTCEASYIGTGSDDEAAVYSALIATVPASWAVDGRTLPRRSVRLEPESVDGIHSLWRGTVRYGLKSSSSTPPAVNTSSFSFDTSGGTRHITQSLATTARYPATAPDFKGVIGYDGQSIAGVDITVPVYTFSETHYKSDSEVTLAYRFAMYGLTGKVNEAAWHGFAAGELLFLGSSGSQRDDDVWEITYRFSASPNRTNLTVGDLAGISKKGWEYMWVSYADVKDDTAGAIVKQPAAVYIEQVYESGDFGDLAL